MAVDAAAVRAALGLALPGVSTAAFGPIIRKAVVDGWSQAQLLQAVYASKAFKARFPAIRNSNGSLRMSPAEYIQRESDLRSVMQQFGLSGFHFDKPSDFAGFISGGVDAQQLGQRLQLSQDLLRSNPEIVKQIQAMYGISSKAANYGALAWLLNPKAGTAVLEKQVTAAQAVVAARHAGFDVHGIGGKFFEGLAGEGVSGAQANQVFQQAGLDRAQLKTFAARYHTGELSDSQIAAALFHPDVHVQEVRQNLFAQEASQFKAGAGFALGQGRGVAGLQTTESLDR